MNPPPAVTAKKEEVIEERKVPQKKFDFNYLMSIVEDEPSISHKSSRRDEDQTEDFYDELSESQIDNQENLNTYNNKRPELLWSDNP